MPRVVWETRMSWIFSHSGCMGDNAALTHVFGDNGIPRIVHHICHTSSTLFPFQSLCRHRTSSIHSLQCSEGRSSRPLNFRGSCEMITYVPPSLVLQRKVRHKVRTCVCIGLSGRAVRHFVHSQVFLHQQLQVLMLDPWHLFHWDSLEGCFSTRGSGRGCFSMCTITQVRLVTWIR